MRAVLSQVPKCEGIGARRSSDDSRESIAELASPEKSEHVGAEQLVEAYGR